MSEEQEVKNPESDVLPEKLSVFKEDFAMMIETGFIAIKQIDETSARRILEAAQILNPSHTATQIGFGHIHLQKLQIKQATAIFQGILEKEPEHELAQCFLGICYLLTKDQMKKGEEILKNAKEKSTDETIHTLVVVTLEWAERDLKKKKGIPFYNPAAEEKLGVVKKPEKTDKAEEKKEEKSEEPEGKEEKPVETKESPKTT